MSTEPFRFLNLAQVIERTSLSDTTIRRLRKSGQFPEPLTVHGSRVAWDEREITQWQLDIVQASHGGGAQRVSAGAAS